MGSFQRLLGLREGMKHVKVPGRRLKLEPKPTEFETGVSITRTGLPIGYPEMKKLLYKAA